MRTFRFVVLALVAGLVAGFAATVTAGFAWMHYAGVFDRDGGISMSVFFGLGPIGAIVAGVIAAALTFLRIRRRERLVAAGARPPPQRWPLRTRVVVAVVVWGVGAWLVIRAIYWLRSPMSFETYAAALIVSWLPLVVPLIAAALAAGFVLWRNAPREIAR